MKQKIERSEWFWIGALCLLALGLRIWNLNSPLWYDEILTVARFIRLPTRDLVTTYTSANNHVLYSLQAQSVVALFGESAWTVRLPAAIFGVLSIAATWWLARLLLDRTQALISAAFLAVSYHHIWFSQNARGYTGLLFWTIVATALFIESCQKSRWSYWLAYAFCVGAAGFTHLSAAFFFAAHGVVYLGLLLRRKLLGDAYDENDRFAGVSGLMPLWGMLLGAGLTILFHAGIIPQIIETMNEVAAPAAASSASDGSGGQVEGGTPQKWKNPIWTVLEVLRSFGSLGPVVAVAIPVALVLLSAGGFSLLKKNPICVAVYATHVPLTLALLMIAGFRIWPRYFLLEIGFVFICLTRGIFVVTEFLASRRGGRLFGLDGQSLGLAAGITAICASLVLLPKNYRFPKQDFAGALAFIKQQSSVGDQVATLGLATAPFEEYYKPNWSVVENLRDLQDLRKSTGNAWVVYSFSAHTRGHYPEVMKVLSEDFSVAAEFPGSLGDGDVYVMKAAHVMKESR
jgi:hypothetical protein